MLVWKGWPSKDSRNWKTAPLADPAVFSLGEIKADGAGHRTGGRRPAGRPGGTGGGRLANMIYGRGPFLEWSDMGELETSLAVLFKRKGKNVLTEAEFQFAVSLDFRWFTPQEAQQLMDLAIKRGLLERTDTYLKPTFDYKDVEASLSFRPSKEVLAGEKEELSVFAQLVQLITSKGGLKKREAVARINKAQERLGVDVEVAALVVARDLGLDIAPYLGPVRSEVLSR